MKGALLRVGVLLALGAIGWFGYLVLAQGSWSLHPHWYSSNPQMYVQPHVRTYQAPMPHPPMGSVPRQEAIPPLPTARQAWRLTTRPAHAADIQAGKTYYEYYCVFCHGDVGDGNGPVGESYVPRPADLRSPQIRRYSDGQLLRACLTGTGHEPVLEYTVLPEHRWYIVQYVRYLNALNLPPKPPEPGGAATP